MLKQKRIVKNSVRFSQCHLIDPFFFFLSLSLSIQWMTLKYTRVLRVFGFLLTLISLCLIHLIFVCFETKHSLEWVHFDNILTEFCNSSTYTYTCKKCSSVSLIMMYLGNVLSSFTNFCQSQDKLWISSYTWNYLTFINTIGSEMKQAETNTLWNMHKIKYDILMIEAMVSNRNHISIASLLQ